MRFVASLFGLVHGHDEAWPSICKNNVVYEKRIRQLADKPKLNMAPFKKGLAPITVHRSLFTILAAALTIGLPFGQAHAGALAEGAFIQFSRNLSTNADACDKLVANAKAAGFHDLYAQWTAVDSIAFFQTSLPYPEQHELLEPILNAAQQHGLSLSIGLTGDPEFWTHITAPNTPLRDYFLTRVARNEELQKELLKKFGTHSCWTGYYIPDEIDDVSWRTPERQKLFHDYLALLCKRLRANDPSSRTIAISAFFRARTARSIVAENLMTITADTGINWLLLQDGQGLDDPMAACLPLYYQAIRKSRKPTAPDIGVILELFRQTNASPFRAAPATPDRVRVQAQAAAACFSKRVVFSIPDYANPDGAADVQALHRLFVK